MKSAGITLKPALQQLENNSNTYDVFCLVTNLTSMQHEHYATKKGYLPSPLQYITILPYTFTHPVTFSVHAARHIQDHHNPLAFRLNNTESGITLLRFGYSGATSCKIHFIFICTNVVIHSYSVYRHLTTTTILRHMQHFMAFDMVSLKTLHTRVKFNSK